MIEILFSTTFLLKTNYFTVWQVATTESHHTAMPEQLVVSLVSTLGKNWQKFSLKARLTCWRKNTTWLKMLNCKSVLLWKPSISLIPNSSVIPSAASPEISSTDSSRVTPTLSLTHQAQIHSTPHKRLPLKASAWTIWSALTLVLNKFHKTVSKLQVLQIHWCLVTNTETLAWLLLQTLCKAILNFMNRQNLLDKVFFSQTLNVHLKNSFTTMR